MLIARDTVAWVPSNTVIFDIDDAGAGHLRWTGGGPFGNSAVTTRQIWFQQPDRVRVEVLNGRTILRAAVRDGTAWWRWDLSAGETAGDLGAGDGLPPLLDIVLLNPEQLLPSMRFDVTGMGSRASRQVISAIGTGRGPAVEARQRVQYEFDREHGTPLYIAQTSEGRTTVTEVTEARYVDSVDPDVFRFRVREGAHRSRPVALSRRNTSRHWGNYRQPRPRRSALSKLSTVWLTGLSGAGKTTIAVATERLLHQLGLTCCVLDGDRLRQGLSSDLDLSRDGRREQARRTAHVALTLSDSGVIPIVALVSPYASDRNHARELHAAAGVGFVEVWIDTPVDVCAARDETGLYAGARAHISTNGATTLCDGSGVTGITAPYEPPSNPELRISGHEQHPRAGAESIVSCLFEARAQSWVLAIDDRA